MASVVPSLSSVRLECVPHAHYLPNAQPFFLEQSLEIILMIWVAEEKLLTVCSHSTVDLPTREYAGTSFYFGVG